MVLRGGNSGEADDENSSEEEVPDPTVAGERCEVGGGRDVPDHLPHTGFEMDLRAFTALAQQCGLVSGGRKDTSGSSAAPLLQRADVDILFQACTPARV